MNRIVSSSTNAHVRCTHHICKSDDCSSLHLSRADEYLSKYDGTGIRTAKVVWSLLIREHRLDNSLYAWMAILLSRSVNGILMSPRMGFRICGLLHILIASVFDGFG